MIHLAKPYQVNDKDAQFVSKVLGTTEALDSNLEKKELT